MPKRLNLHKILILGSGPIVIGQGCEFDYSGVQACKALRSVGFEVVLVNSNPATIMTDPDTADHTYIEPITWQSVERIIAQERPDAILSTMGGQTALNCALDLDEHGVLAKYNVELIGANKDAIKKAEDRELFRVAMQNIGLEMPRSAVAFDIETARKIQKSVGFPTIIRPSFTLGGSGGGIANNLEEFDTICERGFALSMNHQLLIEESLLGWKEFELEVIRDANDSCIIVCTIENLDPMGIHTGDSITVAPAQTLTDREYQIMRDAAIAVLREVGVETGGSNVQFGLNPKTGRMVVIEMNPRVSRSSALASKATGFPIAKVAALLAVGYTLDELQNDITDGIIPASFEPSIDYVVVKIPRFNFDKFAAVDPRLSTQMQSVGEVMAIGSTFQAALQKALCGLEVDLDGFASKLPLLSESEMRHELQHAGALRLLYVADAMRLGYSIEEVYNITGIDPWFLHQIQDILTLEHDIQLDALLQYKQMGFSDSRIAQLTNSSEAQIRHIRKQQQIIPKYKRIDSCAAEFPAATAYLYSSYDGECEARTSINNKVIVLGSGPNRIGQGIEFDYCCVQAVQALQDYGIEAIMINCNPETVSTDYDISNRLYFEALRLETVLDIIELENPLGVILQLGGQTPLKLAKQLQQHNVKILGTSPDTIDLAEDRGKFSAIINELGLQQPENAMVHDLETGMQAAQSLGYPLMVRPSYVLGGRAMEIVTNAADLQHYLQKAFDASNNAPILIDRFLQDAIEVDVDVVADGQGGVFIAGVMQHIEPAGVHSGDSASSLPPYSLDAAIQQRIKEQAHLLALRLNIIGLMNIQFAIQGDAIYILEVNPRASRTVPFVSKSIGLSIAKIAVGCMLGHSLKSQHLQPRNSTLFAVKQSVFPFNKFPGADPLLGPEMRSTGEVMGFGADFAAAYLKTMEAIGGSQQTWRQVFICVGANASHGIKELCIELVKLGVTIYTDNATSSLLLSMQIPCIAVIESDRILSLIASGGIDLVISTQIGGKTQNGVNNCENSANAKNIRAMALKSRISLATTIAGAHAMLLAIQSKNANIAYKLQAVQDLKVFEYDY